MPRARNRGEAPSDPALRPSIGGPWEGRESPCCRGACRIMPEEHLRHRPCRQRRELSARRAGTDPSETA
eukprot:6647986-Alexandrium_andersonii.AAC.1